MLTQQMIVVFSLGVPVIVMMETAVLSIDDCCFQSWCSSYCYDGNCCFLNRWLLFSVLVFQLLLWCKLLFSHRWLLFSVLVCTRLTWHDAVLNCLTSLTFSSCFCMKSWRQKQHLKNPFQVCVQSRILKILTGHTCNLVLYIFFVLFSHFIPV